MRNTTIRFASIAALSVLLAAAPATRPAAGQYQLRVCRYHGDVAVVTAEFSADLDRPFTSTTRMGSDTLTISGSVQPTGRARDVRLHVTIEEVHSDPQWPDYKKLSTTVEPDLGQEQPLGRGPGDTRIAVTVTGPMPS